MQRVAVARTCWAGTRGQRIGSGGDPATGEAVSLTTGQWRTTCICAVLRLFIPCPIECASVESEDRPTRRCTSVHGSIRTTNKGNLNAISPDRNEAGRSSSSYLATAHRSDVRRPYLSRMGNSEHRAHPAVVYIHTQPSTLTLHTDTRRTRSTCQVQYRTPAAPQSARERGLLRTRDMSAPRTATFRLVTLAS